MPALLFTLFGPFLVFPLPWAVPLIHRRWTVAALLFAIWVLGILVLVFLWFGFGLITLLVSGVLGLIEVSRESGSPLKSGRVTVRNGNGRTNC